jgi:hypothetical protein
LRSTDPSFEDSETILRSNHLFFVTLIENFHKHQKYLESLNRSNNVSAINANNFKKTIFGTFMKMPEQWRNVSGLKKGFEVSKEVNELLISRISPAMSSSSRRTASFVSSSTSIPSSPTYSEMNSTQYSSNGWLKLTGAEAAA